MYLIEFPPGQASQLHVHPVPAVGYVLEGRFESAFGDAAVVSKQRGEGFVDLANAPHRFRNADPDHWLRFVIAGTFRKDQPLFRLLSP
jgi:quercetin dioxygenase-like cupin family protein